MAAHSSVCSASPSPIFTGVDDSAFPLVRLLGSGDTGYAFAWAAALGRVIARNVPFVLVDGGGTDDSADGSTNASTRAAADEEPDREADRGIRRHWMRKHAEKLVPLCRGLIVVQGDVSRRMQAREQGRCLAGGLPLRIVVVSKTAVAEQLARVLLAHDVPRGASRAVHV